MAYHVLVYSYKACDVVLSSIGIQTIKSLATWIWMNTCWCFFTQVVLFVWYTLEYCSIDSDFSIGNWLNITWKHFQEIIETKCSSSLLTSILSSPLSSIIHSNNILFHNMRRAHTKYSAYICLLWWFVTI